MGQLYEKMKADLKLRRYSARTQKSYLYYASRFVRHFMRPPTELGKDDIRRFLGVLEERGESASSVRMYLASLRFLYATTLERPAEVAHLPWPRAVQRLPAVLSPAEVDRVLAAIEPLICQVVIMTAYGTGLRISEALSLETEDIDGDRGLIHVRHGKGDRERYVVLPRRLLEALRQYWRQVRPPGPVLFPGQSGRKPLCPDTVRRAVHRAVAKVGLGRRVTVHAFRHYPDCRIIPRSPVPFMASPSESGRRRCVGCGIITGPPGSRGARRWGGSDLRRSRSRTCAQAPSP